jgi:MFS family permease
MDRKKIRIFFLYLLTFLNHAVVSWLILALPKINQHSVVELGMLMSVKPLVEAVIVYLYSVSVTFTMKRSLLFCLFGMVMAAVCFASAIYMHWFYLLFLAQFLLGIGCSAIYIVQVFLAKNSSVDDRTRVFNVMEWSIGVGMSLGPIVGVWVVHSFGPISFIRPFLFIAVIYALMVVFMCFQKNSKMQENCEGSVVVHKNFYWYLSAWICFMFSWQGYYHWFPSLMYNHFSFTHKELGYFYTKLGLFYIFCQFLIVNLCTRFKIHKCVIIITLFVLSITFLVMGMTNSLIIMYVVSGVYMVAISFFLPFWKAYLSLLRLRSHRQLFSIITIATSLCAVASTLIGSLSGSLLQTVPFSILFSIFSVVMLLSLLLFLKAERANI